MLRNQFVSQRLAEIDTAISASTKVDSDPVIQSYLARFLVVYASGIYEACVEHLVTCRAGKTGDLELESHVRETISHVFRNPDFGKIKDLLATFNPKHRETLGAIDEKIKNAVTSINNNKNLVAHGSPCSATVGDVLQYHSYGKEIFPIIENLLGL